MSYKQEWEAILNRDRFTPDLVRDYSIKLDSLDPFEYLELLRQTNYSFNVLETYDITDESHIYDISICAEGIFKIEKFNIKIYQSNR